MSNDSAMLILITAAIEGRDVAIADIAGAYLKAEMNDFVLMKLEGATVDIMLNGNHQKQPIPVLQTLCLNLLANLGHC